MNEQNQINEKVDAYLLGHLDREAKSKFEIEINENQELARSVASKERLIKAMSVSGRRKMKLELKEIHREVIGEAPKVRRFNWRPLLVAASALFLGAALWLLNSTNSVSNDQLFADNYSKYELKLAVRDSSPTLGVGELTQLYRNNQYAEAIPLLQTLLANEEASEKYGGQLRLALATASFETGDAEKALEALRQILDDKDPFLSDEARWYAALINIEQKNDQAAILFLKNLADNPNADHHKAAQKILKSIE